MALATRQSGFGGVQPTNFSDTAASPTSIPYRSPFDPRNDPNDPWAAKGAGPGFTPPEPAVEPTPEPESQPQTFFEKFPTPQDAWKDWLGRMGKFLARQPGEVPNFPGPWGAKSSALANLPSGRYEGPLPYTWEMAMQPHDATFSGIGGKRAAPPSDLEYDVNKALF